MRKTVLLVASFTTMAMLLGGCQSSLTGDSYSRDEARRDTDARITVRDGYVEMKLKAGKRLVFDYVCLPDTVKAQ